MADLSVFGGGNGNGHIQRKSSIRDWFDRVSAKALGHDKVESAGIHVIEGVQAVRQGGEALLTGAFLGFVDSEMKGGLNATMGQSTVPIDGAIAGLGLAASVLAAGHHTGIGVDARNIGSAALSVYTFRMTKELLATKKASAKVAGEAGCDVSGEEDAIEVFARDM